MVAAGPRLSGPGARQRPQTAGAAGGWSLSRRFSRPPAAGLARGRNCTSGISSSYQVETCGSATTASPDADPPQDGDQPPAPCPFPGGPLDSRGADLKPCLATTSTVRALPLAASWQIPEEPPIESVPTNSCPDSFSDHGLWRLSTRRPRGCGLITKPIRTATRRHQQVGGHTPRPTPADGPATASSSPAAGSRRPPRALTRDVRCRSAGPGVPVSCAGSVRPPWLGAAFRVGVVTVMCGMPWRSVVMV